jgi:IrrE N-terminal-like domain
VLAAVDKNADDKREPLRDQRADALRLRYHERYGGDELPVPVVQIAGDLLGLDVRETDDLEVSGMLLPARREIWLNATESEARRRFTLAHELGHWVCQCLEGRVAPVMCRPKDVSEAADRALEREANIFAAELLMPAPAIHVAAGEAVPSKRFGVSDEAMRWRLYSFGLGERPA